LNDAFPRRYPSISLNFALPKADHFNTIFLYTNGAEAESGRFSQFTDQPVEDDPQ